MTKQVGYPSPDPVDALVEIMQTCQRRMNEHGPDDPPGTSESFTLGLIMGTACRSSVAVERYKALEKAREVEGG